MKSLRKSIDNHCKQCIYDPLSPGRWREQVQACTAPSCALFEVRPVSRGSGKTPKSGQIENLRAFEEIYDDELRNDVYIA